MGVVRFKVWCYQREAQRLADAVREAREQEKEWLKARRAAVAARVRAEDLTIAARDVLLDEVAETFAGLRASGRFAGTRTLLVMPALQAVLAERGWAGRSWRPVPPRHRQGRPWGTHDQHFDDKVALYLPDELAELVVRGCYWTSLPAVTALQRWYDQHGDHWRGRLHDPEARWVGVGPSHEDLRRRDALAGEVVTTGRILREAIKRAVGDDAENRPAEPPSVGS
jgi:hypothetical protein